MALTKEQIQQIAAQTRSSFESGSFAPTGVQCLFDDVHDAIDTAIRAQHQLMDMSLEERGKLIEAMRVCAREHAEELAILAHEETGYGKVPHKIAKNLLAANKTPGIEDLHPTAFSGDNGLTLVETAPYGVIGAIHPVHEPHRHHHQQLHQHDLRGQRRGVQPPSGSKARLSEGHGAAQ